MNTIRHSARAYCRRSGIPHLALCFAVYLASSFVALGTALAQQQPISVDLPAGKDVKVYTFTGIPAAQLDITIVCRGPNAVYYHTEGNPPGFGKMLWSNIHLGSSEKTRIF